MKTIDTLVKDIYDLFSTGQFKATREEVDTFSAALAERISVRIGEERGPPTLRLSNLGTNCDRKLWYGIHTPEKAEELPAPARIKYLFGDILEELLFWLARVAGHKVEGEQDEVMVEGVVGHRDGIIDGVLVDAKSASSFAFKKFADGLRPDQDNFGYLTQLDSYAEGSKEDELVVDKDRAAFLVIDKQLGKIHLDVHKRKNIDYKTLVTKKREMLEKDAPPPRPFVAIPDGKSGNMKLGVECSYCPFRNYCWENLRAFAYSGGPRFLTRVVREPDVPEMKWNENKKVFEVQPRTSSKSLF